MHVHVGNGDEDEKGRLNISYIFFNILYGWKYSKNYVSGHQPVLNMHVFVSRKGQVYLNVPVLSMRILIRCLH